MNDPVRDTENSPHFEVRVTSDSHFSWLRTRLSLDRTMMSWVRTGTALIGFGFTIVQFFRSFADMNDVAPALRPDAPRYLGLALIGAGIVALLVAFVQYRQVIRYLWSPPYAVLAGMKGRHQSPVLYVALLVALIGVFAFCAILIRAV